MQNVRVSREAGVLRLWENSWWRNRRTGWAHEPWRNRSRKSEKISASLKAGVQKGHSISDAAGNTCSHRIPAYVFTDCLLSPGSCEGCVCKTSFLSTTGIYHASTVNWLFLVCLLWIWHVLNHTLVAQKGHLKHIKVMCYLWNNNFQAIFVSENCQGPVKRRDTSPLLTNGDTQKVNSCLSSWISGFEDVGFLFLVKTVIVASAPNSAGGFVD